MKRSFILLLTFAVILTFSGAMQLYAQTDESIEVSEEEIMQRAKEKLKHDLLLMLQKELSVAKNDLFSVKVNTDDAENRLSAVRQQITTLSEQLANLDNQIINTGNLIENVTLQINQKENELMLLLADIEFKNVAINNQKKMLMEYLKLLYERESHVADTISNNEHINIAKMLLNDVPVSQQLQQIRYFNLLENQGHQIFDRLEALMDELEEEKIYAAIARVKLKLLYDALEDEKANLKIQKEAKENLLIQTRGEEDIYQSLIEESKKQQEQILSDIKELQEHLALVQRRIAEDGVTFDTSKYKSIFSGEKVSVYEFINETQSEVENFRLNWPVEPTRGLSAYYQDASYRAVFGIPHNAIDIPVPQNTIIRAPADGVVYKAKDNGMGYSYLILAHRGGYMTVYGHLPEFLVGEGEKVAEGQPIGLSGGMPGTKGAGMLTTGAHLHFEVTKGGKYVDPLYYLDLERVSGFKLPDKYKLLIDTPL
jgi:murein DD-endopeptidase MepM/ murein hydrolase activator NlpD